MLGKCFQKNYEIPLFFRTLQSILGRFKLFKGRIRVIKMVFYMQKIIVIHLILNLSLS